MSDDDELDELLGVRPDAEVAELLGLHRGAVSRARREAGLPPARRRRGIRARLDAVCAALAAVPNATAAELAAHTGLHYRSVWRYLLVLEEQRRARPVAGAQRPMRWAVC